MKKVPLIGILAGMVVPKIMSRPDEAKQLKAKMQIQTLETALKLYKLDNGSYPTTEQGLQALVSRPDTGNVPKNYRKGGYLEKNRLPKDPWSNPYIYLSPGVHDDFDITSYGSDSIAGGEGKNKDINSWEIE